MKTTTATGWLLAVALLALLGLATAFPSIDKDRLLRDARNPPTRAEAAAAAERMSEEIRRRILADFPVEEEEGGFEARDLPVEPGLFAPLNLTAGGSWIGVGQQNSTVLIFNSVTIEYANLTLLVEEQQWAIETLRTSFYTYANLSYGVLADEGNECFLIPDYNFDRLLAEYGKLVHIPDHASGVRDRFDVYTGELFDVSSSEISSGYSVVTDRRGRVRAMFWGQFWPLVQKYVSPFVTLTEPRQTLVPGDLRMYTHLRPKAGHVVQLPPQCWQPAYLPLRLFKDVAYKPGGYFNETSNTRMPMTLTPWTF